LLSKTQIFRLPQFIQSENGSELSYLSPEQIIKMTKKLPSLEELSLDVCDLKDEDYDEILKNCPKLKYIDLIDRKISEEKIIELEKKGVIVDVSFDDD